MFNIILELLLLFVFELFASDILEILKRDSSFVSWNRPRTCHCPSSACLYLAHLASFRQWRWYLRDIWTLMLGDASNILGFVLLFQTRSFQ